MSVVESRRNSRVQRYQDCARTEVQSSDVFQVGDAVDSTKCFFQSLHDDGRDCLAGDKAAGLVGQNPRDTNEQKANGYRGRARRPM